MTEIVAVLAKSPERGKVKTRLASAIGEDQALEVYKFLLEKLNREIDSSEYKTHVHLDSENLDSWTYFQSAEMFQQSTGNVGERMSNSFLKSFDTNSGPVVLVGTDIPDLNASILKKSFQLLEQNDVVIGPSEDGGYYLIGMNQHHPEIFQLSAWSHPHVLKETIEICDKLNLSYSLVDTLNDIDTFEDLKSSSIISSLNLNFGPLNK